MIIMTAVLIIWPSHSDFRDNILKELSNENYTIKDYNSLVVSKKFIKNILREIHYGKTWWDINIDTEYKKRITNDDKQIINYLIVEKNSIHNYVKSFKKRVREKYNIDKSYFHISDPDCFDHLGKNCDCKCNMDQFNKETKKHIYMLTNKNTIHFLNNATFKKEYNFYTFLKRFRNILKYNKSIDVDNFCIDNGGILASYGIRDTHDLDFLTLYNDDININDKDIGCENKNHRAEYKILGYTIKDIVENPNNHFYHFGFKFMSLEILEKFKFNRTHTIEQGIHILDKKT